jgi:type I restriction enzyme M protein
MADVPGYARMVPLSEIASDKNDYNLNLPRYIDSSEQEDIQDLSAHLSGGIPDRDLFGAGSTLGPYWQVMPTLRATLFKPLREGYSQLQQPVAEVKAAILGHAEFIAFQASATQLFATWQARNEPRMKGLKVGDHPKAFIEQLSEDLLATFKPAPLVDAYSVYQHLMDYWAEAMQDDAYAVAQDGWVAKPTRIIETDKKGKKKDKGWACDLVPKALVVARYFAAQQAALDAEQAKLDATSSAITELEEEHSGDDAVFAGYDKITAAAVKDRIKEIKADPQQDNQPDESSALELKVLNDWLKLSADETALKKRVKELDAQLDQMAHDHYAQLSVAEIQQLVVNDKWLARMNADVQGELNRVSQTLTRRIRELAERYAVPLPGLVDEVEALSAKVGEHLSKMGVTWH